MDEHGHTRTGTTHPGRKPHHDSEGPLADRPRKAIGGVFITLIVCLLFLTMFASSGRSGNADEMPGRSLGGAVPVSSTLLSGFAGGTSWLQSAPRGMVSHFILADAAPANLRDWLNAFGWVAWICATVTGVVVAIIGLTRKQGREISPNPLNVRKAPDFVTVEILQARDAEYKQRLRAVEERTDRIEIRIGEVGKELADQGEVRARKLHERIDRVLEGVAETRGAVQQINERLKK